MGGFVLECGNSYKWLIILDNMDSDLMDVATREFDRMTVDEFARGFVGTDSNDSRVVMSVYVEKQPMERRAEIRERVGHYSSLAGNTELD